MTRAALPTPRRWRPPWGKRSPKLRPRRLPDTRDSITHRFNGAGHEGYLTVGLYDDGTPGELFITMAKEGSTIGGLMDCLGTAISVALQYGVPIESLVNKFAHQRFEPMGMTTNCDIPFAKSLVDYIFRWMGMEFIAGYREANMPKRPSASARTDDETARGPRSGNEGAARSKRAIRSIRLGTNGDRKGEPGIEVSAVGLPATAAHQEANLPLKTDLSQADTTISAMDRSHAVMMGDAPACEVCGSITIRNSNCYKCLNCGNSMGCS